MQWDDETEAWAKSLPKRKKRAPKVRKGAAGSSEARNGCAVVSLTAIAVGLAAFTYGITLVV